MSSEEFQSYYQNIYKERWPSLLASLKNADVKVERVNSFAIQMLEDSIYKWAPFCRTANKGEISRESNGLLSFYVLDPASVFVAHQLDLVPGGKVLDMCAAPGGKSHILAQRMFRLENLGGELYLNEYSENRRDRLKKVIQNYVPVDIRKNIWIKGKDAALYGVKESESYDSILLDAPCSGEKHTLESPEDLEQWSPKRTKGLHQKQYSMLVSALMALKKNGSLVYSTCSISPLENDGVIQNLIDKKSKKIAFEIQKIDQSLVQGFAESTQHGLFFAPDIAGMGPMYICKIKKID